MTMNTPHTANPATPWRSLAAALALCVSAGVQALPQGGATLADGTTITQSGSGVTINQTANRTVINWNSYNLANGETVTYNMPGNGAVLNLINQGSTSVIDGSIFANGAVYLINPHGIQINPNAFISVGSLVASSLVVDPNQFLSGGPLNFQAGAVQGTVINNGNIIAATGGSVALVGNAVINRNNIEARAGSVTLASGEAMTLDFDGNGLMQFAVTGDVTQNVAGLNDAVNNSGRIIGTNITLEGHVAARVFTNAVNHSGLIIARSFGVTGGGNVALVGEGANVVVDRNARTQAENTVTRSENLDDLTALERTLASSSDPAANSGTTGGGSATLGLYNVDGPGIRLPADQMEEEF